MAGVNIDRQLAREIAYALKHTPHVLSSEDFKVIDGIDKREIAKAMLESGERLSEQEIRFINSQCGEKFSHNFDDADNWNADILAKYADHVHNYYYNYKPEAVDIDPSIDPNEQHIGPMAQDIEKVNPAAIEETSEGVKTVDTGRLALMNAGAIAELARQVRELHDAKNVPSDAGIKTDHTALLKSSYKKPEEIRAGMKVSEVSMKDIQRAVPPSFPSPPAFPAKHQMPIDHQTSSSMLLWGILGRRKA